MGCDLFWCKWRCAAVKGTNAGCAATDDKGETSNIYNATTVWELATPDCKWEARDATWDSSRETGKKANATMQQDFWEATNAAKNSENYNILVKATFLLLTECILFFNVNYSYITRNNTLQINVFTS